MQQKNTSVATHFVGLADAPVQCRIHGWMEGVQGFVRSHWTLPSGKYLLGITPANNGVACKKNNKKSTMLAGHFNGHGGVLVGYCAYHQM
jgi:hypothetical protein